jgi:hypothetical protein
VAEFLQRVGLTLDIAKERRDIDVEKKIRQLRPSINPFLIMLMEAAEKSAGTAEFGSWEERPGAIWTQINNGVGYDDAEKTFAVDDESIFVPGDILKVTRTGETMRVESVNAGAHTVTVEARSWGTVAAAAILDNDWILNISQASAENSGTPTPRLKQPVKVTGYAQLFRTSASGSGTQAAEDLTTSETEEARQLRLKAMEHKLLMEMAFMWSEAAEFNDSAGKIVRTTTSLNERIVTNVFDCGGLVVTENKFEEILEAAMFHGTGEKVLFPAPKLASMINAFAIGKMNTTAGQKLYGVNITRYRSAHGELAIAPVCKAFEKGYNNVSFIVDFDAVAIKYLRRTKLRRHVENPGVDGWVHEYLTEAGLLVTLEETCTKIHNFKVA